MMRPKHRLVEAEQMMAHRGGDKILIGSLALMLMKQLIGRGPDAEDEEEFDLDAGGEGSARK